MDERLEIALVREIELARTDMVEIAEVGHASPYQWANACHDLFEAGRMDTLEFAVRRLQARYPDLTYLNTLLAWFDAIPREVPMTLPFCEDATAEVQILRRPHCDAVLLCFCACRGTLGLPVNFVHQWLGRIPASLVYIKDLRESWGGLGFPTLGPDRHAAVSALRRIAADLGAKRVYTFGVSRGGYPALHYGLELEARGVLCLGGATNLTPDFVANLDPMSSEYADLLRLVPDYLVNLRDAYLTAARKPRAFLAYGRGHPTDRRQAEQMAGLPNVELIGVEHGQHNVIDPLIRNREFLPLLQRLLAADHAA